MVNHGNCASMQGAGLPPQYAAELTKLAKVNAKVLVASSSPRNNADSPVQWTAQGKAVDDGVQLYTGHDASSNSGKAALNLMCGVVYVQAPLHEVVHALVNLTANPYFKRFIEDPVVMGSRTLYDMDQRDRRATRIQWMAIRSASTLMQHRDFVVVQHQDEVEIPARGRGSSLRGWVSCIHSVNLPMVPPFAHTYVRGGVYASGLVLKETNQRNVTEAVMVLKVDFKGFVPRLFCNGTLKAWMGYLGRVAQYFRSHRSTADVHLPRVHLSDHANASESERCSVCHDPFGVHSDKDSCRKCHKRVCSGCTTWANVELDVVGRINVVVCTRCARHAKKKTVARQVAKQRQPPHISPKQQPPSPYSRLPSPQTPQSYTDHRDDASPRFTQDIPMRLSAASWMDTLTCHPPETDRSPPTNQQDGRPRQGSVPTPYVGHHGAENGRWRSDPPHRSRHSLSPTRHGRQPLPPPQRPPQSRQNNVYMGASMLAPQIRLKSSAAAAGPTPPSFQSSAAHAQPWAAPTTTMSSTAAQCSFYLDRDSRQETHQDEPLDDTPRHSDASRSVVQALTTTGNVLDLSRGDVASFRL